MQYFSCKNILLFLWGVFFFSVTAVASETSGVLTNRSIFVDGAWTAEQPSVQWFHEGHKLVLADQGGLVVEDIFSGEQTVLVESEHLIPEGSQTPLVQEKWFFSEAKDKLLIFTNSRRVWRHNTRGDYWVLDLKNRKLTQLGGPEAAPASLMFAKFSPDGRSVAYVRDNNILLENSETHEIKPLTTNGGDRFINGTFDWVYEEEFGLTDGFCWSPDSRFIAFWELDTEGEPTFTMVDNISTFYPKTVEFKYPRAGLTNAAARIGVISVETGQINWVPIPGDPRENYITAIHWPKKLLVQQFNRLQNRMTLYGCDGQTVVPILDDADDAWIDLRPIRMKKNGDFLFESERNGFRQIFHGPDPVKAVTPDNRDVIAFAAFTYDQVGEESGFYFYASSNNATQKYLYGIDWDGNGLRRITPQDQPGTHQYQISPDGLYAVHTWSQLGVPPMFEIVSLPDHKPVRLLSDNADLKEKLRSMPLGKTEFLQVKTEDGVVIDGWCIFPAQFDPSQKYPVLVHVYGEPAGQTVLDRWGGGNDLWHQMLSQQGYIVVSFDNRGTPAPKGRDWRKSVYRNIGVIGPRDQAEAIQAFLRQSPWADPNRVGIWGWSGGGSMTLHAMFQYPDIYKSGIAIAPVSDERYYDTIYQERYMGNPAVDAAEDYRKSSPIHYANNLQGELLLVHGTGDDNCHYQTTELLINELIRHNKSFTMMAYPFRSHGIHEGEGTTLHLRELMTRFLREKLPTQ